MVFKLYLFVHCIYLLLWIQVNCYLQQNFLCLRHNSADKKFCRCFSAKTFLFLPARDCIFYYKRDMFFRYFLSFKLSLQKATLTPIYIAKGKIKVRNNYYKRRLESTNGKLNCLFILIV